MRNQSSNFIDYVRIFCKSGNGGKGSTHLRREKYIPKGGPDGGDGGRGGHIILRGDKQLWTLIHLKYRKHIKAENGGDGSGQLRTGADGKDIILKVPLGTVAKDGETGEVLFEIVDDGQEMILAGGGRGGLGNANFKSSTNQTPRYAQPGEEGIEGWFVLELKILADVGLVGFPNAGKSTLLSVVSAAKPKIADYAFTTLEPNLGIVNYYDDKSFVMADIPGIIEGAHEGRGLGLRFLRHIERNSMLLFMIPADSKDIAEEYGILLNELKQYNPELLGKERLLAVTKSDMLDDELKKETKKHLPKNIQYIFISSLTGEGIPQLKDMLWKTLNADGEIDRT
jgi:GTP-binding protein